MAKQRGLDPNAFAGKIQAVNIGGFVIAYSFV